MNIDRTPFDPEPEPLSWRAWIGGFLLCGVAIVLAVSLAAGLGFVQHYHFVITAGMP